ncbi:type VII secretion target [Streptomyces sp. NBRC 110028]|uniref:type VII secretion target n=1 Tax=Streptomyces sp. NBRC 110028 TaxID=1621260 RepID=UPI0006E42BF7|nr:type VII secretion target [Streptomyces sp. NBRC 110028]
MSFDEQWASFRTQAAERQATRTQINSFDAGGTPSPKGKLKVTPKVLRDMADKADDARRNFAKADNQAVKETSQVKDSLKGFDCATAFDAFEDRWRDQMRYVQGLLEHGVAGALRNAAAEFQVGDKDTADKFKDHDGNKRVAR